MKLLGANWEFSYRNVIEKVRRQMNKNEKPEGEKKEVNDEDGLLSDLSKKDVKVFWILVVIIVVIIVGFGFWADVHFKDKPEQRGVFGDQFGAVNALFSGLAFCGVIIAILLQRKELKAQQEELKETRKILTEQKDQIREQKDALKQQVFETTFFNLIERYEIAVNNASYGGKEGRPAIHSFFHNTVVKALNEGVGNRSGEQITNHLVSKFDQANSNYGALLDKPMHILESACDYLADAGFETNKERFYSEYLEGNLSEEELRALSIYALTPKGKGLKVHIDGLGLLANLDRVFAGQAQLVTEYEFLRLEVEKNEEGLKERLATARKFIEGQ